MIQNIHGVTVLETLPAKPPLGFWDLALPIVGAVVVLALLLFLVWLSNEASYYLEFNYWAVIAISLALFEICFIIPTAFSKVKLRYGQPERYEIVLSNDADRVTLMQHFKVVEDNDWTIIVEPRVE